MILTSKDATLAFPKSIALGFRPGNHFAQQCLYLRIGLFATLGASVATYFIESDADDRLARIEERLGRIEEWLKR